MGIADIKSAFAKAAPGIDLRAVRMRYEDSGATTVLEFDICRPDGSKQTVEERLVSKPGMKPLINVAMQVATALGAKVEVQDDKPQVVIPAENTSQSLMAEAVGIDAIKILNENATKMLDAEIEKHVTEVEHDGETYELVVDDKPKALFF
jgi:hypothetical protein